MSTCGDDGKEAGGLAGQPHRAGIALADFFFSTSASPRMLSTPGCRALVSEPPAWILRPSLSSCANPPCLSQGVDPTSDAFGRINIKYIHDDEELQKYFVAFYLQGLFLRAIITDDFYDLFDERYYLKAPKRQDLA